MLALAVGNERPQACRAPCRSLHSPLAPYLSSGVSVGGTILVMIIWGGGGEGPPPKRMIIYLGGGEAWLL